MDDEIIWHMGGNHPLSSEIKGKDKLFEILGKFSQKSNGTFRIVTEWYDENNSFVAASVISKAERSDDDILSMHGIDLFKIENGKIKEVWTFAQNQEEENKFWSK